MDLFTKDLANGVTLINHTNIKSNINKNVMVFGKVSSVSNGTMFLSTTEKDNHQLIVKLKTSSSSIQQGKYVGVVGRVEPDESITCLSIFDEEMENFDFLDNYNKLIDLYTTKKELEPFI